MQTSLLLHLRKFTLNIRWRRSYAIYIYIYVLVSVLQRTRYVTRRVNELILGPSMYRQGTLFLSSFSRRTSLSSLFNPPLEPPFFSHILTRDFSRDGDSLTPGLLAPLSSSPLHTREVSRPSWHSFKRAKHKISH